MQALKRHLRRLLRTRVDLRSAKHKVSAPDETGHEQLLAPGVRVYRDRPELKLHLCPTGIIVFTK